MNRVFYDIDNEPSAYWFGFFLADGNVYARKDGRFAINLCQKDPVHLQKFVDFIGDGVVGRRTKGEYVWYVTQVYCSDTYYDLLRHGCLPNKSKLLGAPLDIPDGMEKHIIRGYNDGDGGIYINKGYPRIRMRGTVNFLEWVKFNLPGRCSLHSSGPTAQLFSHGWNHAIRNIDFMYSGATVSMNRKLKIANELMRMHGI